MTIRDCHHSTGLLRIPIHRCGLEMAQLLKEVGDGYQLYLLGVRRGQANMVIFKARGLASQCSYAEILLSLKVLSLDMLLPVWNCRYYLRQE